MLTLVFAMSLVDISALAAYLVVAMPRPLAPGAKTYVDVLEACIGVWEFALVASVALQISLCASCWRVYKELRTTGLYPPGTDPAAVGVAKDISVMEIMCEAEDVELLADCEMSCETGLKSPLLVCGICAGGGPGVAEDLGGGSRASAAHAAEVITCRKMAGVDGHENQMNFEDEAASAAACGGAADTTEADGLGPRAASEILPGPTANVRTRAPEGGETTKGLCFPSHALPRGEIVREQTN
jgi:hypothetical protein